MASLEEPVSKDDEPLTNEAKAERKEHSKRLGVARFVLPLAYLIIALFLCIISIGYHSSAADPHLENLTELLTILGSNLGKPPVYNLTVKSKYNQTTRAFSNSDCDDGYERLDFGSFPEAKEGCICTDKDEPEQNKLRCAINTLTCGQIRQTQPKVIDDEFPGRAIICVKRYKSFEEISDKQPCPEGTHRILSKYCADLNVTPVTNFELRTSTNRIGNSSVISYQLMVQKEPSKLPLVTVLAEIGNELPCLSPRRGPKIDRVNKSYPAFGKKWGDCGNFGSYDTNLVTLIPNSGTELSSYLNTVLEQGHLSRLPFFLPRGNNTASLFYNPSAKINFYTVGRINVGTKAECKDLVQSSGSRLQEVPRLANHFGNIVTIVFSIALLFDIIGLVIAIVYYVYKRRNKEEHVPLPREKRKKLYYAYFSFSIIVAILLIIVGIFFFAALNELSLWDSFLKEGCVTIPGFQKAVESFLIYIDEKFMSISNMIIINFSLSVIFLVVLIVVAIFAKVKKFDILELELDDD